MNNSKEKTFALVTGGSSGIGLAYAEEWARKGYNILIVSNREDLNTEAGTFHNGERIRMWEPERLEPADIIRIGGDEIVYSERYPG